MKKNASVAKSFTAWQQEVRELQQSGKIPGLYLCKNCGKMSRQGAWWRMVDLAVGEQADHLCDDCYHLFDPHLPSNFARVQ